MSNLVNKIKLKGNESFNIREGWLRKGMRNIIEYPNLFSRDDVMELLGVGSKMAKSIRYWLKASNLCVEKNFGGNKARELSLTDDFGSIIYEFDPYFEDPFTLLLIHYHIVANKHELCTVWDIFFNEYDVEFFHRDEMYDSCEVLLQKRLEPGVEYSRKSLQDDCASVLRMYLESEGNEDPESNLGSPFSELKLLKKDNKGLYQKTAPSKEILSYYAILYVILQNATEGKTSISIKDLCTSPNNIGHIYNLNRSSINEYLDQLRAIGYITINRTAGLDMIYLNTNATPSEVMVEYYRKAQER